MQHFSLPPFDSAVTRKQPCATPLRRESGKYHCGSHVFRITTPSLPKVAKEREVAAQPNAMVFIGEAQRTDASNRRSQPYTHETGTTLPSGISRETSVLPDDFALSTTMGAFQERLQ